jgi:hypothetical protein
VALEQGFVAGAKKVLRFAARGTSAVKKQMRTRAVRQSDDSANGFVSSQFASSVAAPAQPTSARTMQAARELQ